MTIRANTHVGKERPAPDGSFRVGYRPMRTHHVFTLLLLAFVAPPARSADAAAQSAIDGRTPIALTPVERDYVLAGMREHVSEIQSIVEALASSDRERARVAALRAGSTHFAELTDHPPDLAGKWPAAWKLMLRARLQSFDALAKGIQDGESQSQSLQRLSTAMQTCTACHAAFRLTSTDK